MTTTLLLEWYVRKSQECQISTLHSSSPLQSPPLHFSPISYPCIGGILDGSIGFCYESSAIARMQENIGQQIIHSYSRSPNLLAAGKCYHSLNYYIVSHTSVLICGWIQGAATLASISLVRIYIVLRHVCI